MKQLTQAELDAIQQEVERDYPDDPMMQEIRAIRLRRYYELRDRPIREQIRGYLPSVQRANPA
ncbi:MAG: hypothetical protein AAGD38_07985 [Acidobacteriota bacterium]